MQIVLASNNLNKINELQDSLSQADIEVLSQAKFGVPEVEEIGLTFVENAILKARNASFLTNLPALADDSGLMVDALHGAPGIHSARFAGMKATARENIEKLLCTLRNVSAEKRAARFCSTLVYLRTHNDPEPIICRGVWEGSILFSPRGDNGFGYDPVFFVEKYKCSAAELPLEIKNRISHRAQAARKMLTALKKISKVE